MVGNSAANASPLSGDRPLTVNFTATASDAEGPVTYSWDFDGDGDEDSQQQNPSFTYMVANTFTPRLTVRDAAGAAATQAADAVGQVVNRGDATDDLAPDDYRRNIPPAAYPARPEDIGEAGDVVRVQVSKRDAADRPKSVA